MSQAMFAECLTSVRDNYYFEARNRQRLADKLTRSSTYIVFHSIKTLDMENCK